MNDTVLQLVSSSGLYGAEKVLLELAAFVQEQGARSIVGVFLHGPSATSAVLQEAQRMGLETAAFAARGPFDTRALSSLVRFAADNQVRVVHTHGYKGDVHSALAPLPRDVRRVATCHNWITDSLKLMVYELLDKWSLHRFDQVVAVSPQLEQNLLQAGISPERLRVIENGVAANPPPDTQHLLALRADLGASPEDKLIVRVGRLGPEKANDVLLRAAAPFLVDAGAKILLVGDGEQEAGLKELAAKLGIADQVIFAGYRNDVAALLAASDLFVISSHDEGLPIVLLEAMAAGVPVVSTAVGAIPRVIQADHDGLLVPAGNPVALGQALQQALGHPEQMQKMAQRARATFTQHHSRRAMGEKYLALYQSLSL